jgi:hypothetical protein
VIVEVLEVILQVQILEGVLVVEDLVVQVGEDKLIG